MKTLLLSLVAIFISLTNIFAQSFPELNYVEEHELTGRHDVNKSESIAIPFDYFSEGETYKSINGKIWVQDSSYLYFGNYFLGKNDFDWYSYSRHIALKRDSKGREIEGLSQIYRNDNWVNDVKNFAKINDENGEKESISFTWDSISNKWGDTVYYKKMINDLPLIYLYLIDSNRDGLFEGIKKIWRYDEDGKLEYLLVQQWSPVEKVWVNYERMIEEQLSDNEKLSTKYQWDKSNNKWLRDSENYSKYDERGNNIYFLHKEWDDLIQEMVNNQQWIYDFNRDNIRTLSESYKWDFESGKWLKTRKYITSYSDSGLLMGYELYKGEKGTSYWKKKYKRINSYNTNSTLKSEITQVGLKQDTLWHNDYRKVYEYQKDTIEEINQRWINNDWIQTGAKWYSYDSFGNLMEEISKLLKDGDWQNLRKILYKYNSNNKIIRTSEYEWDNNDAKWDKVNLFIRDFDDNDNMTLDIWKSSDTTGDNWENIWKYTYFYSQFETTKLSETENTISVFPNPAKDFLWISMEQPMSMKMIKVYTSNGIKVLDKTIYKNKIDVSSLEKGIYFIEILLDNKLYKSKFVKSL